MAEKKKVEIEQADSYKNFKVGDRVRGPGGDRGKIESIWRPAPRGQWRFWVFWDVRGTKNQWFKEHGYNVLLADGHSVYPSMVDKAVR